jgi:DNA (cytosine-5)-methyltransferase 1
MKIPILSFFTGAGFLDIGFLQSNFNVVWRNEVEPWFIKGFSHGMLALTGSELESKVHNTHSIIDVGPIQILKEAFGRLGAPKPLVLLADHRVPISRWVGKTWEVRVIKGSFLRCT